MNNCKDNMMKCNNTPKLEGLRDRLITVAYFRYDNANTKTKNKNSCVRIKRKYKWRFEYYQIFL